MLQIKHETPAAVRIRNARTALLLDHPFFGALLVRLKGRERRSISTMAPDGASLYYNPEFVDTLNSATLAGVLAHEVMHPALQHHVRRSGRDLMRWNVACDYAITPLLLDAGLSFTDEAQVPMCLRSIEARIDGQLWEKIVSSLPSDLERLLVTCVRDAAPSNEAIKQAIQSQTTVPGAEVYRGDHLRVA